MANNKYIIADTESNGPEEWADVYQLAWQITDAHFSTIKSDGGFLEPVDRMKPKARRITGFDRKTLKKLAEPAEGLYYRFLRDLHGCKAIIGHSVDVDIARIINDAQRRCSPDLAEKIKTALSAISVFDTAIKTMEKFGKKVERSRWIYGQLCYKTFQCSPSLVELARKLGIKGSDIRTHSADGDVELTRRCMVKLQESYVPLLKGLGTKKKPAPVPVPAIADDEVLPPGIILNEDEIPQEGKVYHGRVSSILEFGVFIRLSPSVSGFLPRRNIFGNNSVDEVRNILHPEDELDVKVICLSRMTLAARIQS